MDKLSSEQQVCGGMTITLVMRKNGTLLLIQIGFTSSRQTTVVDWLASRPNACIQIDLELMD